MPIADSYGQNVPIATLTDPPNAQTLAGGIVNGIVPKVVMTFTSASVRGATIVSPTEGMVSWVKDTNRLEVYNGTAWVTIAAGSTTWTTISLASGWSHDGNDNGNFQYKVADLNGDRTIFFRGAIKRTSSWPGSMPSYFTLGSSVLPADARPATLRTINVPCSDVGSTRISLKLDIRPDGELRLYGAGSNDKPAWVGFNGTFCAL